MGINRTTMWIAASALTLTASAAFADARDDFRSLATDKAEAVVTLEIVMSVKANYGGQQVDREQRIEGIGFIVDDSGLLVTSLSTVDPGTFYARQTSDDSQVVTRAKSIKYILDNRDEVEASVVLRDEDFDLAFLKPLETKSDMTYIDIDPSTSAELLDQVFAMSRAPRIGKRAIVGITGEIQSVIERPRRLYVPSSEITTAKAGAPVYTTSGKLLGINAYYSVPGGTGDQSYINIIVPVSDIAEIAKLAKEAEPEPIDETAVEEPMEAAPAENNTEEVMQ